MLIATQVVVEVDVKLGKKRGEYEAELGHKKNFVVLEAFFKNLLVP